MTDTRTDAELAAVQVERWEPVASSSRPAQNFIPARRDLPAMPQMLAADPEEAAITAAAMKSMMSTQYVHDTSTTKAVGAILRTALIFVLSMMAMVLMWCAAYLVYGVDNNYLLLSLVGAVVSAVAYYLYSERMEHAHSSAGVERHRINTARNIHRDRLESRERMHGEAVDAWREVLGRWIERG